jgi:REP element-mobilizing transposase RayT
MRKNRLLKDGADYHVSVKINRGEMLLKPTAAKNLFLAVIARAKKKFNFQIKNFCLMDNHVHLIIHPGKRRGLWPRCGLR